MSGRPLRLKAVPLDRLREAVALVTVPADGAVLEAELRRSAANPARLALYVGGRCREAGIPPAEAIERWPLAGDSILAECQHPTTQRGPQA